MGEMGGGGATTDVDDLVRRATEHPLGLDFLKAGSLDAVSATFSVHAFVVDAARDVLTAPIPHVPVGASR